MLALERQGELGALGARGRAVTPRVAPDRRTARGEHPDWDDYDRAMIRDRRLIIEIAPARAYGGARG